jgi:hypothetical protein
MPAANADISGPGLGAAAGATGATGANAKRASLFQLKQLIIRINGEILRLQQTGTLDPVVTQRISLLQNIGGTVNEIIRKVQTGQMTEANIPITEAAYNAFLPVMSNINSPLPNLLAGIGASSALNNLFPLYAGGDISGAALAKELLSKYAGDFFKNLSWDLSLKHKSQAETKIAEELAKSIGKSQFGLPPPISELLGNQESPDAGTYGKVDGRDSDGHRGQFDSAIKGMMGYKEGSKHSGPLNDSGGAPEKLDWKKRAEQICDQISKRGLSPYDYGCKKAGNDFGEGFSYRGYARMICSRLETNYDPGIPALCGCPPPTWSGWKP